MVNEASYLIKKCKADNDDMREIVVRYDEILCTKLDKSKIEILRQEFKSDFTSKVEFIEHLTKFRKDKHEMDTTANSVKNKMNKLETQLSGVIDDYVEASLHAKMKHYDHVAAQFSKFFHEDDLATQFKRKVDINLFNKMTDIKASREELNQTLHIIDTLYERLRNLSLLQVEMARSLVPHCTVGS
jgi:hypothetical protein